MEERVYPRSTRGETKFEHVLIWTFKNLPHQFCLHIIFTSDQILNNIGCDIFFSTYLIFLSSLFSSISVRTTVTTLLSVLLNTTKGLNRYWPFIFLDTFSGYLWPLLLLSIGIFQVVIGPSCGYYCWDETPWPKASRGRKGLFGLDFWCGMSFCICIVYALLYWLIYSTS